MEAWTSFVVAFGAVLALMTLVWLLSLARRDASIVDVFWGLGFAAAGGHYFLAAPQRSLRGALVLGLVTLWGLRLSLHILQRSRGKVTLKAENDIRISDFRIRRGRGGSHSLKGHYGKNPRCAIQTRR